LIEVPYGKINIWRPATQPLNVFTVSRSDPIIRLCVDKPLNRDKHIFDDASDVFRFEIAVTAPDVPPALLSLRVQMGETWNKPKVEVICPEANT